MGVEKSVVLTLMQISTIAVLVLAIFLPSYVIYDLTFWSNDSLRLDISLLNVHCTNGFQMRHASWEKRRAPSMWMDSQIDARLANRIDGLSVSKARAFVCSYAPHATKLWESLCTSFQLLHVVSLALVMVLFGCAVLESVALLQLLCIFAFPKAISTITYIFFGIKVASFVLVCATTMLYVLLIGSQRAFFFSAPRFPLSPVPVTTSFHFSIGFTALGLINLWMFVFIVLYYKRTAPHLRKYGFFNSTSNPTVHDQDFNPLLSEVM